MPITIEMMTATRSSAKISKAKTGLLAVVDETRSSSRLRRFPSLSKVSASGASFEYGVRGASRSDVISLVSTILAPLSVFFLSFLLTWAGVPHSAWAQANAEGEALLNEIQPYQPSGFEGRRIERISIVFSDPRWQPFVAQDKLRKGDEFSERKARDAIQQIQQSGKVASVAVEVESSEFGLEVRFRVVARRVVSAVALDAPEVNRDELVRVVGLGVGQELTPNEIDEIVVRTLEFYRSNGYYKATVSIDTDDESASLDTKISVVVDAGEPTLVSSVEWLVEPKALPALKNFFDGYGVEKDDIASDSRLARADAELEAELRKAGWFHVKVRHELAASGAVKVEVIPGTRIRIRFEGYKTYSIDKLKEVLALEEGFSGALAGIQTKLVHFYQSKGFLDARVKGRFLGKEGDRSRDFVLTIIEGSPIRVASRLFGCDTSPLSSDELGEEIDAILAAELPGGGGFSEPNHDAVAKVSDEPVSDSYKSRDFVEHSSNTYSADAYVKAAEHLKGLYRSKGYLSAEVGPAVLLRRRCDPRSPANQCIPIGVDDIPATTCPTKDSPLPLQEENLSSSTQCISDPLQALRCEPQVRVYIPVKVGPQAILWDVQFTGNHAMTQAWLASKAQFSLGQPVSYTQLQEAKRRVVEAYQDEGYAFVKAEVEMDLSPDKTRARARMIISEFQRVKVTDVEIRGALITDKDLIAKRVLVKRGDWFRRNLARESEELIGGLGVFNSVRVVLETPEVPAKEKRVIVQVSERKTQYVETRAGFSTGQGIRGTLEYGHKNVGGKAIRFVARLQMGYLPHFLLLDDQVKERYENLTVWEQITRRNSVTLEFPDIGLGHRVRLGLDVIDVRDNARDFGLTREAFIATFYYQISKEVVAHLGASVELNDSDVFNKNTGNYLPPVPQGYSFALAQRIGMSWDRRDNSFAATRGTFLTLNAEYVNAFPLEGQQSSICEGALVTNFIRWSGRVSGYIPLNAKGLVLAGSLRSGYNQQLVECSESYPDRYFFMGGFDTIRGFAQLSLMPEDIAQGVLSGAIDINDVQVRGGDFTFNPRVELRIPLTSVIQTALFLDSGNVWRDPLLINLGHLRYTVGSGLRAMTPVGPMALDYGFNLDPRPWETIGEVHFSIGLY